MSKPHEGFKAPEFPGQTKTMFYNEGNPAALLVTNKAGRRVQNTMPFPRAEAALDWCRQHACAFVFLPVDLAKN